MTGPASSAHKTLTRKFLFRFTRPFRIASLPFGVLHGTCGVVLSQASLIARFGPWAARTGLDNVDSAELIGPFDTVKTAGLAHLSFADRGLTSATNPDLGVCIRFHRPVTGMEPFGLLRHPGLTVTVADCAGLIEALKVA